MAALRSLPDPLQVRALADSLEFRLPLLAQKGLQVVGVLLLAVVAFRVVRAISRRITRAVDDTDPNTLTAAEQRGRTLAQLLNNVGAVTIVVGAALTILNLFVPIGPLLAGVGVAGLAISFGAQSLVKDVISGFFIVLENQFAVGDIIEIEGASGVVERMTLRVVMLRDAEGALHIVPNGNITKVSNKTRGFGKSVVDVAVAYKEDVDRVLGILRDILAELAQDPQMKADLTAQPAVLGIESMSEGTVNFRIVATTRPGRQWEVGREVRRRVKIRFDKEGIIVPQRGFQIGDLQMMTQLIGERGAPKAQGTG